MLYRRLGASGLPLSVLSFGAWATFGVHVGRGVARELVAMAWDHGINFFDNAETYANGEGERVMGDVLADLRLPRDGWCVSSKAYFGAVDAPRPTQRGLSRKHLRDACDAALRRLRVDYLDLYFCHRPDPEVPVEEIVTTMDLLVRQGKVLYWGTSEWPAERIAEACALARSHGLQAPVAEQPQYNLLERRRVEAEYAPLYAQYGLGTTIFSPLASGLLTGKYNAGVPADSRLGREGYTWLQRNLDAARRQALQRFAAVAGELGVAPAPLAIAWCLRNPHVSSVLLGASTPEQLAQNLHALQVHAQLDEAAWERVEACFAPLSGEGA